MAELTPTNSGNGYEQASTSNDVSSSISNAREEVSISIPQKGLSGERRIQKVPAFLRVEEQNKCNYDPIIVSFGPYHHGKSELKLAEDFKPRSLELFAEGSREYMELSYNEVLKVIHEVRRCYVKNPTDTDGDATFAQMMLYDACFILNYIIRTDQFLKEVVDHLGSLGFSLIQRDIFLLENQIPFWFLKLLFHLKYGTDVSEEIFDMYMGLSIFGEYNKQTGESNKEEEELLHLLEGFRRIMVADCKDMETNGCEWLWKRGKTSREPHLGENVHSFHSVSNLKAKGIHFRPSRTKSLKAIKFKSSYIYAELQLPIWYVSSYTRVFFLNMVAFEMCPHTQTDKTVSSYLKFMKSLIESPKDVEELREKQIILNQLGSDEEVLQVYKDINTYGVNNDYLFYEVKNKIQEHYNSKAKTWLAEFIHNYFRSPWSAIALFAATFILCLTFIQTYFAIHPSFDN